MFKRAVAGPFGPGLRPAFWRLPPWVLTGLFIGQFASNGNAEKSAADKAEQE
jgi:hypothetical protein